MLESDAGKKVSCTPYAHQVLLMNSRLRELPLEERIRLVEELWDSIAADQQALPLTPEQRAELDRRLDDFEADKNRGQLLDEAIAEIRRRL